MRVRFIGVLAVSQDGDDAAVPGIVSGRGQQALLLRLAVDAGTTVGYRAPAEDVWGLDSPDDPRAALQSLVSRLRRSLSAGAISSVPGGYRLELTRADVDVTRFQDLVSRARETNDAACAREALALWTGEVWVPHDGFDWLVRDLLEDRAHAERIAASEPLAPASPLYPAALNPLVGRGDELDAIRGRLTTDRLVTVLGPGGAGKTTLAVETARAVADSIVVELVPAAPGDVWTAIAGAVGRRLRLPESSTAPLSGPERVAQAIAGRSVVIVLDNCEHVVGEAAEAALTLLGMSPAARVLATSREPLGVPGEAFVDLGPLPPADADALFAQRVRSARGRVPDDDERSTAERIVRRLDGLPLAIELAAARTRTLTLPEIDRCLDDRFALLSNGLRLSSERHRTLRALIDWSWDTLTEGERSALCAAAVFPDSIGADDASAIARRFDVDADTFDALVDRSLQLARGAGGQIEVVVQDALRSNLGWLTAQVTRHARRTPLGGLERTQRGGKRPKTLPPLVVGSVWLCSRLLESTGECGGYRVCGGNREEDRAADAARHGLRGAQGSGERDNRLHGKHGAQRPAPPGGEGHSPPRTRAEIFPWSAEHPRGEDHEGDECQERPAIPHEDTPGGQRDSDHRKHDDGCHDEANLGGGRNNTHAFSSYGTAVKVL